MNRRSTFTIGLLPNKGRGYDLPGAKCTDRQHVDLWLRMRGEDDGFWWDSDSPNPSYAVLVCQTCPVQGECLASRPVGMGGVWGGRLFRGTDR